MCKGADALRKHAGGMFLATDRSGYAARREDVGVLGRARRPRRAACRGYGLPRRLRLLAMTMFLLCTYCRASVLRKIKTHSFKGPLSKGAVTEGDWGIKLRITHNLNISQSPLPRFARLPPLKRGALKAERSRPSPTAQFVGAARMPPADEQCSPLRCDFSFPHHCRGWRPRQPTFYPIPQSASQTAPLEKGAFKRQIFTPLFPIYI